MPSITAAALQWQGKGYVFGGPGWPPGDWDCSSFASTVLNEADPGIVLPGGGRWGDAGYPPHEHGPDVAAYASWAGAQTVQAPQPGDLVIWGPNGHIGFYLGPNQMISALNPGLGVRKSGILGNGPGGSSPTEYRRVLGVDGGTGREQVPGGVDVTAAWQALFPKLSLRDLALPAVVIAATIAGSVLLVGLLYLGGTALAGWAAASAGSAAAGAVVSRVRERA